MKRFPSRLVVRIYAVGIVQFALVAFGIFVFARQVAPPPPQTLLTEAARLLGVALESKLNDPSAVQAELTRLEQQADWSIAVYDPQARLVAHTSRLPPPKRADRPRVMGLRSVPLHYPDGQLGTLVCHLPPPAPPPHFWFPIVLVLVVVGITAWLTARSLARPLSELTQAASAFGSGQLGARATLDRNDELGDLSRAFNEMAQRIASLLRAEKELIANVSHELRTPLARIQVALDLAAEGDAESARESLSEIAEDLAELERIVNDVLAAARLALHEGFTSGSAVPPIRVEDVDMHGLVERAIGRFRISHPARAIELQFGSVLPNTRADAVLFRRALDNLLDNADKYTEDSASPISVVAHRAGAEIVIEVRDQGIGIAPENLQRVFEPFYRVEQSRARATGGHGLGLALARRIIEAHAGTLKLSARPGGGTVARIDLPIVGTELN
ncbi:MAG TPA: HAMP domain-containing sensor histidine kinase [Polyangiales bacterium]|nr:HAMP domain-containing sensor histidine kinase [Polyangiales bacterium]